MIKIIADSSCNLPDDILEKYDVTIIPITITIKGKTYIDYEEITPNQLFEMLPDLEELPTTAAPSPSAFMEEYARQVEAGIKDIIVITISSEASATHQSAVIAKDTFLSETDCEDIRIHVVDSLSMSHGSGYLIIKTGEMIKEGKLFEEIIEFNEEYKTRVKHYLSVSDLDNLIKSGRLSHVTAIIGKALNIAPILTIKKGRAAICGKVRGRKKIYRYYIDELKKRIDNDMTDFIILGYTSDISYAQNVKALINTETDFEGDVYIWQIGATTGTHVGLGCVSMFFIEKPKTHHYSEIYSEVKEQVKHKVSETWSHLKK